MADLNIYEKLRKVQLELKVPKNQRNNFGGYNYRSAEDIVEASKPVCDKHGLTLLLGDEIVHFPSGVSEPKVLNLTDSKGNAYTEVVGLDRYYVKATAAVYDEASGTTVEAYGFAREDEYKKGMDGAQITGAASSYSRKYALNGLFAIDDTKDADSNEHQAQRQEVPKAAPRPAIATAKAAVGTAKPAITRYVTEAQAKLLLARARDASGLTDRQEIYDFFLEEFGKMPNEVARDEIDDILKQLGDRDE